ncbi:unnamed protein product [Pylaiella littoralis]
MKNRGPKRSRSEREKQQQEGNGRSGAPVPGTKRTASSPASRRSNRINNNSSQTAGIFARAMSLVLPRPPNAVGGNSAAIGSTTSNMLAEIRRRRGGVKGRSGVSATAGIVILFSALCAALLWVGVGSFSSHRPAGGSGSNSTRGRGSEGKTRASAAAPGATSAATAAATSKGDASAATRNLARRPELKTRGGQLAFARFSLLAEYPHDSQAFTQGLSYEGGFLYESTGLFGGKSTVRKVDTETGEVLQSVKLGNEFFGEGMVIVGDKIHSLTWRSGVGFSWDLQTFEQLGQFSINTKTGQGWGITTDGSSLVVSDGSQFLFFWDPVTMKETRRVEVKLENGRPLARLNELEMVKGYVFANVWFDDNLYKIDPITGTVVDSYNFSELYPKALKKKELNSKEAVLNGIAWDPEEDVLYVTGKLWPRMYKVKLREGDEDGGDGPESSSDRSERT